MLKIKDSLLKETLSSKCIELDKKLKERNNCSSIYLPPQEVNNDLRDLIMKYTKEVITKIDIIFSLILLEKEFVSHGKLSILISAIKRVNCQRIFSEIYSPKDLYSEKELLETCGLKNEESDLEDFMIPHTMSDKIIFFLITEAPERIREEIIRNVLMTLKDSLSLESQKEFRNLIHRYCSPEEIFDIENLISNRILDTNKVI